MTTAVGMHRYRGFISYSHADAEAARWLHRRLEAFVMPSRLVGHAGPRGPVTVRLTPIFKDREELAAAHDLSDEVRGALDASACLIVLATPASARSRYVEAEITEFRTRHPDRPILVALWQGEPADAFAPGLRIGANGSAIEPLAADFRKTGDGRRLALLKLIAGLAGVELDALVQREAQRRLRRVTAVTVAALIGMLAMGLLAAFAFSARAEAERQRGEAEGLVEYMLTDLRDQLKGVGRLDVLTSANRRALAYYASQDLSNAASESLQRRARLFEQLGHDDERRGSLDRALAYYREAHRTTSAQLAAQPEAPDRIFAAAQTEYYLGHIDERRGNFRAAAAAYGRYRDAAQRLVKIAPGNPVYMTEMAYAQNNLGILALKSLKQPEKAIAAFTRAQAWFAAAAARDPGNLALILEQANCLAWLADAEYAAGDLTAARRHRLADRALKAGLLARDPRNRDYMQRMIVSDRALALIDVALGQRERAAATLTAAANAMMRFVADDPPNADWREQAARIGINRAELLLAAGQPRAAAAMLKSARATLLGPRRQLTPTKDSRDVMASIDAMLPKTRVH